MTCMCRRERVQLTGLEEPLFKGPDVIKQLFVRTVNDFDRVDDDMLRAQRAGKVAPQDMVVWEDLYTSWSDYAEDFGLWDRLWGSSWHDINQYRERLSYWDNWLRSKGIASGPRITKPSEQPGTFDGLVSVLRWGAVIGIVGVVAYVAAPTAQAALRKVLK